MKIKKTTLILFAIFILAFALRVIAAYHVDVSTDEMVYSLLPLNIISANTLGNVFQSHLYFYLADVGYNFNGGLSPLAVRFPSIVFGSFAVLVIYLLAIELFQNKRIALISSFLFALSGYALQFNIETDMPAFFLILLSTLFFLRGLMGSHNNFYLSSLFIALAMLVKNIVVMFIPAYLIVLLIYSWREKNLIFSYSDGKTKLNKQFVKVLLISASIFILITSPVLIYNYMIYKYRGITDIYFSSFFGLGENIYKSIANKPWDLFRMFNTLRYFVVKYFWLDIILLVFGTLGLIFSLKKNKYASYLFMLMLVFILAFVGGITGVGSHALWVPLSLSIFAGSALVLIHEKIKLHFRFNYFMWIVLLISIILNILYFQEVMEQGKSNDIIPFWKFVHKHIPEDAIVIMDPRIYRGNSAWVLNDRHYLEGTDLPQLIEIIDKSPLPKKNLPIYYIECGPGSYCGWKAEDFAHIESTGKEISDFLVPGMERVAELKGSHNFIVYAGRIAAPSSIYDIIDKTHVFWFYPVGWKFPYAQLVDDYEPRGGDILLNAVGFLILYLNLLSILLSLLYVIYLIKQQK